MSSSSTEQLVDVLMPAMGTSVSEGTLLAWNKAVGDPVALDETVCEVTTDKSDSECPSPVAGVLVEILVQVGQTVDVGTPLARIAVEADGPAKRTGSNGDSSTSRSYSPVVTRMAAVHDLDLTRLSGSGRNGRVTKKDVQAFMDSGGASSAAVEEEERPLHSESPYQPDPPADVAVAPAEPAAASTAVPPAPAPAVGGDGQPRELSRMRQSIGRAMVKSLTTAATCTTIVECDMSAVERSRKELGVTALPVLAGHVVRALRDFGDLNATLDDTTVTHYDAVHLGIAVSLGEDGLVVPVIRDAQDLSVEGLGRRIKELATAARARQLGPDDFVGATFTITSPGAFGAIIATPVINVPQVAILDIEAIVRRPVVVTDDHGSESIAIRSMAHLCMSWDHRALDGVYAARFLTALRHRVEDA